MRTPLRRPSSARAYLLYNLDQSLAEAVRRHDEWVADASRKSDKQIHRKYDRRLKGLQVAAERARKAAHDLEAVMYREVKKARHSIDRRLGKYPHLERFNRLRREVLFARPSELNRLITTVKLACDVMDTKVDVVNIQLQKENLHAT